MLLSSDLMHTECLADLMLCISGWMQMVVLGVICVLLWMHLHVWRMLTYGRVFRGHMRSRGRPSSPRISSLLSSLLFYSPLLSYHLIWYHLFHSFLASSSVFLAHILSFCLFFFALFLSLLRSSSLFSSHLFLALILLVLSRYQNVSIRYRYQWKSTVLGTNFGTKAKHKNMLIKKHTIFINKVKQN